MEKRYQNTPKMTYHASMSRTQLADRPWTCICICPLLPSPARCNVRSIYSIAPWYVDKNSWAVLMLCFVGLSSACYWQDSERSYWFEQLVGRTV